MKNIIITSCILGLISLLEGCAVVGGIFKAGVWVGVLAVVIILVIIILIIRKTSK